MELRYSLCPACDSCPEVMISNEAVTIGEADNLARLTLEEWGVLVAAIRSGELVPAPASSAGGESCGCGCECC